MPAAKMGDTVRVHYTGKLDDGTVFDSSLDREPLEFTIGGRDIIPGFEDAVIGLSVGERKHVVIAPEDAYGMRRDENIIVVDRSQLPADLDPEPGMVVRGRTAHGSITFVIAAVAGNEVTLDGNHPLAGERLTFDIQLVEIVE